MYSGPHVAWSYLSWLCSLLCSIQRWFCLINFTSLMGERVFFSLGTAFLLWLHYDCQPMCWRNLLWMGMQWPLALGLFLWGSITQNLSHLDCACLKLQIVHVGTFTCLFPYQSKQTNNKNQNHSIERHQGILISLCDISEALTGDDGWQFLLWIFGKL